MRSIRYMPVIRCAALAASVTIVALAGGIRASAQESPSEPAPVYDSDPRHLWNRLHAALWDRTAADGRVYGHDRVDPLLWNQTRHLLEGPSRDSALQVLREFLDQRGENLIDEPLKRAMLQRDLWAIFDWLANPHTDRNHRPIGEEAQAVLRRPLAQVIKRLALDSAAMEKLPDTYAAAVASKQFATKFDPTQPHKSFLPPDLFDPEGPWVCIGRNGSDIIAPAHTHGFSRSVFQVFLKLPDGRTATRDYLTALSRFNEPFQLRPEPNDNRFLPRLNSALPQFPAGTQVALVRSLLLIDSQSRLRATRIVETVQLRDDSGDFEFQLSRDLLFRGTAGGLRPVTSSERDFVTFNALPIDQLEAIAAGSDVSRRMHVVMNLCADCHRHGNSLASFHTFVGSFTPGHDLRPSFFDTKTTARGEAAAIRNKQTRYDWGLLEGLISDERGSAPQRQ
jgi:hypothetical protein